ncbi:WYL domain-containing protein [Saccharophagus degradans]|uniref:WYL domain-containing protein n=1 Tax=Saccharophagus degradans TaxID=86304 RepID=A0AAW7X8R5_9GAMM|nr:WYL domain-containing protein [Saccharophagus degradans]MDO6422764.1 WYL domain-containing protein [Saccharophagus degradans]MDO6606237.1 WYL domain-containing protein [Saccharophagus degradans]
MNDRFWIVETYLLFRGNIQRADLTRHFGVGNVTASRVLQDYANQHPSNMIYSPSHKAYVYSDGFKPSIPPKPEAALQLLGYGIFENTFSKNTCGPSSIPNLAPPLDANIVGTITRAIYSKSVIEVSYISATSGEKRRYLHPHAIFTANGTWYFRAFDENQDDGFRTFRFSRVISAKSTFKNSSINAIEDKHWTDEVTLSIAPHPNHPNKNALATDLGLSDSPVKNIKTNKVLAPFVLQELRVDCSPKGNMPPEAFYLRLMNCNEFDGQNFMSWAPGRSGKA